MRVVRPIDIQGKVYKREYVLMFLLLCISGNPLFVYSDSRWLYIIFAILLAIVCKNRKRQMYNKRFVTFALATLMLFAAQLFLIDVVSVPADINFIAKLYIAFLSASYFGNRFREVYLRTIVFVCLISIPFFLVNLVSTIDFGFRIDRYRTIVLFNYICTSVADMRRNSGMFWEPGAFQGYIMLVPILFYDKLRYLIQSNKVACIILSVAILTTKSTTAYLTLAAFVCMTLLISNKINVIYKVLLLAISGVVMVYFVWTQDFMGAKIMAQVEDTQNMRDGEASWSRTGAMVIDFYNICRHPVIGNGFVLSSRYGELGDEMSGAGNGLTGSINMFGIPYILFFFISLFKNFREFAYSKRLVVVAVIVLLTFGEYFLNYPLFWTLLFMSFPMGSYRKQLMARKQSLVSKS